MLALHFTNAAFFLACLCHPRHARFYRGLLYFGFETQNPPGQQLGHSKNMSLS